jgi:hypothetical protein
MLRVGTLGDLEREQRVVTLYCPEFHSVSWPGWWLVERYGARMPLQRFMDRCRCQHCGQRADDLKVATLCAGGTGISLATRCPFTPPPTLAEPVRVIGALAVALWGERSKVAAV